MSLDRKIILYITNLPPKKTYVLYRYNTHIDIWVGDAMRRESSVFYKGIFRGKVFWEGEGNARLLFSHEYNTGTFILSRLAM